MVSHIDVRVIDRLSDGFYRLKKIYMEQKRVDSKNKLKQANLKSLGRFKASFEHM